MPQLLDETVITDTVDISSEQAVPRSLVHKHSLENVLLTGIRACASDRFICAGRLPTAHRFFNDAGRRPLADILFYTEVGRQASLAISHLFLDVSQEDVFIFEGSDAALTDAAWTLARQGTSDSVLIDVRLQEISRRRNNAVNRVVAEHVMWVGGQQVFRGTGAWTIQPAALFQRLRKGAAVRAEPGSGQPAQAGSDTTIARLPHAAGTNVVITSPRRVDNGRESVSTLIVDDSHPYFFDHACDHVPGMLLLEGCAQMALAACAEADRSVPVAGVGAIGMTFTQFVECSVPTTLTAHLDAGRHDGSGARRPFARISIAQQGAVCGTATLELAVTA